MKAHHLVLLLVLLAGVAADVPRSPFSAEEMNSIITVVRKYRPEGFGTVTAQLVRGPLPDMAFVRLSKRRGDSDEIVCVLTLKKDGKEWKVESCAR